MKRKKGFASIITIMIAPILFIIVLYLVHTVMYEDIILNSTTRNIQSYYLSEGKILMAIHEEKYYENQLCPILIDIFRDYDFGNVTKKIIIDNEDLKFGDDCSSVGVFFRDNRDRKELVLKSNSNYKGLKSQVFAFGTIVNHLFEMGAPILDMNTINIEAKENLQSFLTNLSENISIKDVNIPNDMYAKEFLNYNSVTICKRGKNDYDIVAKRDSMITPSIDGFTTDKVFIICKSIEGEHLDISITVPEGSNERVKLFGLLYVEGNLKISSDFEFNGIIIVKDGDILVESIRKPDISGLLITDNVSNLADFDNDLNLVYSKRFIYTYGTFLPGFLEPKINLIKST